MHKLSLETYSSLVDTIFEASIDPDKWMVFVNQLDSALDSVYLSIYGHDVNSNLALDLLTTKYSDDYMSAYAEHYCQTNLFIPVLLQAPVMQANPSEVWVPKDRLLQSEFYNDWLAPQEDVGSGGGGVLFNEDGRILIMSGQVRFSEEETKTPELISTINLLAPHVRHAFSIQRLLEGQRLMDTRYREALDAVGNAVFLLDPRGRVSHLNTAADGLMNGAGLFYLDPEQVLRAFDQDASATLSGALLEITSRQGASAQSMIMLRGKTRREPYVASLIPFRPDQDRTQLFSDFRHANMPVAMLTVVDPARNRDPVRHALSILYKLTPAETDLVEALHRGLSLQEYASERGVSVHTVRYQVKMAFQKTGTSKQSELVALVARLSAG